MIHSLDFYILLHDDRFGNSSRPQPKFRNILTTHYSHGEIWLDFSFQRCFLIQIKLFFHSKLDSDWWQTLLFQTWQSFTDTWLKTLISFSDSVSSHALPLWEIIIISKTADGRNARQWSLPICLTAGAAVNVFLEKLQIAAKLQTLTFSLRFSFLFIFV